jgi:DNA-binding response OmpR family regulator
MTSPRIALLNFSNPELGAVLRAGLEQGGFEVVAAYLGYPRPGEELPGLRRFFAEYAPAAVLCPLPLPLLSSVTLIEQIRALPEGRAVPIVIPTTARRELATLLAGSGKISILEVPFGLDELRGALRQQLDPPARRHA